MSCFQRVARRKPHLMCIQSLNDSFPLRPIYLSVFLGSSRGYRFVTDTAPLRCLGVGESRLVAMCLIGFYWKIMKNTISFICRNKWLPNSRQRKDFCFSWDSTCGGQKFQNILTVHTFGSLRQNLPVVRLQWRPCHSSKTLLLWKLLPSRMPT